MRLVEEWIIETTPRPSSSERHALFLPLALERWLLSRCFTSHTITIETFDRPIIVIEAALQLLSFLRGLGSAPKDPV
jgi:hypothetical protein